MTMPQISACKESIEASLGAFLKNTLNVEVRSPEDDLIETGVLDSLMLVDLVLFMEQAFNVFPSMEDLEIKNFSTVSRMADFVAARRLGPGYGNGSDR